MPQLIRVITHFDEEPVPLNTKQILERVKTAFPEVEIKTEDPFVARAKYYEEKFEQLGMKDNIVVQAAWKDVNNFSPAYAFIIAQPNNESIHGKVDRCSITFRCENQFSEVMKVRIINFLESFGVGKLEEFTSEDEEPIN